MLSRLSKPLCNKATSGCGEIYRSRMSHLTVPHPSDIEQLMAETHNPGFELLYQQDVDGLALPPITASNFLNLSL